MLETVGYVIKNKKDFYKFLKKNKNTYYAETMYNVKASDWEFLFDKYKIDLNVDLRTGEKLQPKEENWLIKNLLAQIDLKFILKLPTEIDVSNANKVSEDGRTLMWNLVLGEENQIVAEATILNLKNAGLLFIAVVSIGGACFYNYQKRKI